MGFERRGLNRYYYRKKREGHRVISQYIGTGEFAEWTSQLDELERQAADQERAAVLQERAEAILLDKEVNNALESIENTVESALVMAGYHKVKGEWRKQRK